MKAPESEENSRIYVPLHYAKRRTREGGIHCANTIGSHARSAFDFDTLPGAHVFSIHAIIVRAFIEVVHDLNDAHRELTRKAIYHHDCVIKQ